MWSKSDPEADGPQPGMEVVAMNDMVPSDVFAHANHASQPVVMGDIRQSKKVHVGHNFIKITQKVDSTEMDKSRILGLELVSPAKSNQLRCSVAVFVCWTFLVAFGLSFYLVQLVLRPSQIDIGLDLDRLLAEVDSDTSGESFDNWEEFEEHLHKKRNKSYSLPRYIWHIAKNSTRAERLSCAASVVALLLCTALIAYFTVAAKNNDVNAVDRAPHPWNITRTMWRARPSPNNATVERFSPIKLVIIQHTVSPECHRFTICAAELRNLQSYFLDAPDRGWDLPYNFVIGNDGRLYRVRDWNREGAHTAPYNRCSVGIGFIGDYREDLNVHSRVTDLQLQRLKMILQEGVDRGYLRPDYSILGAKDVANTYSPGENLYKALQKLDHFENTTSYRGLTCEQIEEIIN